jgi:hypothetical protein
MLWRAVQRFKYSQAGLAHTQSLLDVKPFGLDALVAVLEAALQQEVLVALVVIQHLAHHY